MSMYSIKFYKNGCLTYYNSPLTIFHLWHILKNDLAASFLGISFPPRCSQAMFSSAEIHAAMSVDIVVYIMHNQ